MFPVSSSVPRRKRRGGGGPESFPAARRRLAAPAAGEKSVICQKGVLISKRHEVGGDIMILPSGRRETERQSVENFRSFCRDISCLCRLRRRRRSDVYHVAFDSSALKITSAAPPLLWSQWEFVEIPIHSSHCHPPILRPPLTLHTAAGREEEKHNCRLRCRLKAVIKEAFKLMTPPLCLTCSGRRTRTDTCERKKRSLAAHLEPRRRKIATFASNISRVTYCPPPPTAADCV